MAAELEDLVWANYNIHAAIDIAQLLGQFAARYFVAQHVGLPQGHATAYVATDQSGVKMLAGKKRCADGVATACV